MQDNKAGCVGVLAGAPGFREVVQWRGPRHGISALGLAVSYGHVRVVQILLQACRCALLPLRGDWPCI